MNNKSFICYRLWSVLADNWYSDKIYSKRGTAKGVVTQLKGYGFNALQVVELNCTEI